MSRTRHKYGGRPESYVKRTQYEDFLDLLLESQDDSFDAKYLIQDSCVRRRPRRKWRLKYIGQRIWEKQASSLIGHHVSAFYDIAIHRNIAGINAIRHAVFGPIGDERPFVWVEIPENFRGAFSRRHEIRFIPFDHPPYYSRLSPEVLSPLLPGKLYLDQNDVIRAIPNYRQNNSWDGGLYKIVREAEGVYVLVHGSDQKPQRIAYVSLEKLEDGPLPNDLLSFQVTRKVYPLPRDTFRLENIRFGTAAFPIPKNITDSFDHLYHPYIVLSRRNHWFDMYHCEVRDSMVFHYRLNEGDFGKYVFRPVGEVLGKP